MEHPFKVGKTFHNRYGRYQVLSIDDPKMGVRYEDGREINLTIAIQTQILEGIQLAEAAQTASPKRARRKPRTTTKKRKKRGPTKADKREKLIAEILENDDTIFDILTRLTIPPGQIDLYRFFLKNPDDYFSRQQIANAIRESNSESQGGVFMAFGRRISASSDPRLRSVQPYNSLFFQRKQRGGKTVLGIRHRVVEIFESYPEFHSFLVNDSRSWLPDEFGSEHWTHNPTVHQRQMEYFGLWDRYQASQ